MTLDNLATSTPDRPAQYDDMTLFRPESLYYFNGERRKRKEVLVTSLVLMVLTLAGALGVGYSALGSWQDYAALSIKGVQGTAVYTRSSSDITHSGDDSHTSYYFHFAYSVGGKRYEERHPVDLITFRRGIPSGQELTIVYDPDHPENVQAGATPTPVTALPQTGGSC